MSFSHSLCIFFTFRSASLTNNPSKTPAEASPNHRRIWGAEESQRPHNSPNCTTASTKQMMVLQPVSLGTWPQCYMPVKEALQPLTSSSRLVESLSSNSYLTHARINHTERLIAPRERKDSVIIVPSYLECVVMGLIVVIHSVLKHASHNDW